MALLENNKVVERGKLERDALHEKGFGELKDKRIVLDLFEACYLIEKEKLNVEDAKGKKVSAEKIAKIACLKDKKWHSKFAVFEDLRNKGYCVKTGFKFGFDFRVYPKGKKMGEDHSQWCISVMNEQDRHSMTELSRKVRLAQNLKTQLLIAVVDREDEVNYYQINRIVP
ncbi:MAG: tRNA-intron lyase [Candidatus Diapherotrites archaeon]|nr:tRNA-intron lyase [Candidatus Diapherotrites archaeon]